MDNFKFKVGDVIEDAWNILVIVKIHEDCDKFAAKIIDTLDDPNEIGTIYDGFLKRYKGWKLKKGYNTPLWKAVNEKS